MIKKLMRNIDRDRSRVTNWMVAHQRKFFGSLSQGSLIVCKKCFAYNYNNMWYFTSSEHSEVDHKKYFIVKFADCPACSRASFMRNSKILKMDYISA